MICFAWQAIHHLVEDVGMVGQAQSTTGLLDGRFTQCLLNLESLSHAVGMREVVPIRKGWWPVERKRNEEKDERVSWGRKHNWAIALTLLVE